MSEGSTKSSNIGVILAVAVIAAALAGGGAYYMAQKGKLGNQPAASTVAEAETGMAMADTNKSGPDNPVVARVNGKEITREDLLQHLQTLPPQLQQQPPETLYPMALDQLVNIELIQEQADKAGLENDEEVRKYVEQARKQAIRSVYLIKEVDGKITDDLLKEHYEEFLKNAPDIEERKVSHILVETEKEAKDIIEKLKNGEDFNALAKQFSKGGNADKGGEVGWMTKQDNVDKPFLVAVFQGQKGAFTGSPIKTQFGYHVIRIDDIRTKAKPTFEEAKPLLVVDARRRILDDMLEKMRSKSDIQVFDIDGNPIQPSPSAGEEAPAAAPAAPAVETQPEPAPTPAPAAE